jgi:putative ABC transport system permease protein
MNDMKQEEPPKLLLRLFKWFCKPEYHTDIEGDLLEHYETRAAASGRSYANRALLKDVLLLFRPGIIRSANKYEPVTNYSMIRSYVKVGLRNLWKSKLYSALNITGLTFGIVCFLLIALFVFDELTFDQQHTNADRIYRVVEHKSVKGEETTIAAGSYKLAEESRRQIPEIENATRVQRPGRANLVDPNNPVNFQESVTIADERFLQIFDIPLIAGDRRTALTQPYSIIINEELAKRIFNNLNVIGKQVQFSHMETPLTITGIFRNHPHNSSFTFTSLMSESTYYNEGSFKENTSNDWSSANYSVYMLLKPDADARAVSRKLTGMVKTNSTLEAGTSLSYSLQRLPDIHLHSENIADGARNTNVESIAQGNPMYIKLFSFTALFVLLIAGINYTNLTTARASGRVKEIGVRKTIGASRTNLIVQFLVESILTTTIAFLLGVGVVYLLLPSYNAFVNRNFSLLSSLDYRFWLSSIALIILIGLLSGGYAAALLSRFNPVKLLKGMKIQRTSDLSVRKALVIFQFTISTVMIIGTMVLLRQVRYMNNTDLGFNKDLMAVIDVNVGSARTNYEYLINEMGKVPGVTHVSATSRVPGEWKTLRRVKMRAEGSAQDPAISYFIGADKFFLNTYDIKLLKGRNFNTRNDSTAVILNESAARLLKITEPSEQVIEIPEVAPDASFFPFNNDNTPFRVRVIGIVKDFHFQSLRDKIQPLVLGYNENPIQPIDYYSVRITSANIQSTLDQLKAIMVENNETEPFEYHFLDEQLARFYIEDERRQTLLGWVAIATVFIACLGLFGLATYSAEQRLKEVSVRKVLGATVLSLMTLVSKDFIKLVLIANLIAFPIAWWACNKWLEQYAYHIDIEWWMFALAAVLATGIALLTVSYQAARAAMTNPVKVLKIND